MSDPQYGLGRLHAPDPRDYIYAMRAEPTDAAPHTRVSRKAYRRGPQLQQFSTGTCVGQAWRNWLSAAPLMTRRGPDAFAIYDAAILVDEWPDNDRDPERQFGSSVRAGARVLADLGHVERYVWAWSVEDVLDWVLTGRGGVILGTTWTTDMFSPSSEGVIRASGRAVGGHAYYLFGADEPGGMALIQNSWGDWGGWPIHTSGPRYYAGCAKLPLEDLDRLIRDQGEACTAVQAKVPRKHATT